MYIYFMPLTQATSPSSFLSTTTTTKPAVIPVPTSDGGIEHTTARFLPAREWLAQARSGDIILFPPQVFLLHLLVPFLSPEAASGTPSSSDLQRQRDLVREFVKTNTPPWGGKCMSPIQLPFKTADGRGVLGINQPGPELAGTERKGDDDRVVLVRFSKEGPRDVEVRWRAEFSDKIRNLEDKKRRDARVDRGKSSL